MGVEQLVQQIRQSTDHQSNKEMLKQQIDADLLLPFGDGLFRVCPSLMVFLTNWPDDLVILEDEYGNPIRCDRIQLLEKCQERYRQAMNRWLVDYERLCNIRKI